MIFVSSEVVAELLNVSSVTVWNRIKSEKYQSRKVPNASRGGFKYEIALDSLPKEAQERYWENVRLDQDVENAKPKRGRPSKAAIRKAEAEAEEVKANEEYLAAPNWQKNASG